MGEATKGLMGINKRLKSDLSADFLPPHCEGQTSPIWHC